jgi:hypothetical protein
MLTEEKAISLLVSRELKPQKRIIGGNSNLVVKLNDDYTFTIREHKTKPGYVYANLKKGDVLAEWIELDEVSLPLAIDYIGNFAKPNIKPTLLNKGALILWISLILSIGFVGIFGYFIGQKTSNCNYQQSPSSLK